ncbi:MAG: hypothetical protein IT437_04095 [Phycisphaerales bacterium]|nr:hypothetical protein [Phycisphaerales bacterium]
MTYTVWVWREPLAEGYALRVRAQPTEAAPPAPGAKAVGTGLTEAEAKVVIDQAAKEAPGWL